MIQNEIEVENLRIEHQKEGIQADQSQGKYTDRKSVINQNLIEKLNEKKNLAVTEIAKVIEIN